MTQDLFILKYQALNCISLVQIMDLDSLQDTLLHFVVKKAKSKCSQLVGKHLLIAMIEEVQALIQNLRTLLDHCCDQIQEFNDNSLHLNKSQTLLLYGNANEFMLKPKLKEELPLQYRTLLYPEAADIEPNKPEKKKRSRQRFSQCEKCLKSWNDIRSFDIHRKEPGKCPGKPWFRILADQTYQCIHPLCSGFDCSLDQSTYWNHVRDKHWLEQDLTIHCQHCAEKFPLVEMMKWHVKTCHKKTKMCRFCGAVFASKNDLAKHERTHTGEKPFACDKCTFRYVITY